MKKYSLDETNLKNQIYNSDNLFYTLFVSFYIFYIISKNIVFIFSHFFMKKLVVCMISLTLLSPIVLSHTQAAQDYNSSRSNKAKREAVIEDEDESQSIRANYNTTRSNRTSGIKWEQWVSWWAMGAWKVKGREDMRKKLRDEREVRKWEIRENMEEARKNREDFRAEYIDNVKAVRTSLTTEEKQLLWEMRKVFESDLDMLKSDLKQATSDEEKKDIIEKIKQRVKENWQVLKDTLQDDDMKILIDQRLKVFEENAALREENRTTRRDYFELRSETVVQYKQAFLTRLGNNLWKLSEAKLAQVEVRVDDMIEKTENNENMSTVQKEKLLSALVALKELIDDQSESKEIDDDVMSMVESILE